MKWTFLLLLFAGIMSVSNAQEPDTATGEIYPDYYESEEAVTVDEYYKPEETEDNNYQVSRAEWKGEDVAIRKFDEGQWKKTINNKNYDEAKGDDEAPKEKKKVERKEFAPWDNTILKIIAYLLIAALIIVVLFNLTKRLAGPATVKINRNDLNASLAEIENIEEVDIRSPLEKALANGDFRLAIRLYYLQLLKTLNEGGTIKWKKDKTNKDYLFEIFQANYFYNEIRSLTLSYEEVWYGEHVLPAESLKEIIKDFENINRQVNAVSR